VRESKEVKGKGKNTQTSKKQTNKNFKDINRER
jgi:hypothetical protein